MELVDAPHSKCGTFGYVGSSPTAPTLMHTYSRFDISFKKGKGCWLWDKTGKKYLDAVAGIATCSLFSKGTMSFLNHHSRHSWLHPSLKVSPLDLFPKTQAKKLRNNSSTTIMWNQVILMWNYLG